jgi:excisionase family DNA binding protein
MDDLLTAREAMAVLRCSRTFLSDHKAELGATRVGTHLRFPRASLDAYLKRGQVAGAVTVEQMPVAAPSPRHGRIASMYPPGTINKLTGLPYGSRAS